MTTAPEILGTLHNIRTVAVAELDGVADADALEAWRVAYLGRREGRLTLIMRTMASLEAEERRTVGVQANDVKALLESQLAAKSEELKSARLAREAAEGRLDVTLPAGSPRWAASTPSPRPFVKSPAPLPAWASKWLRGRRWRRTTTTSGC